MNYFTLNTNEMKREIVNYSNYLSKDSSLKSEKDFLRDMSIYRTIKFTIISPEK